MSNASENRLQDFALWYARRGMAVLPLHNIVDGHCSCGKADCNSPGKHPRTKTGLKEASKSHEQISTWWRQWPCANVGIVTGKVSGILVIDVDGEEGADSLHQLETEYGPLPDTWEQITGGGGRHLVFIRPLLEKAGNRVGMAPGVDIRGDDGYIVAEPSNHISGRQYVWEAAHHPDDIPIAELSHRWKDLLMPTREAGPRELPEHFPLGERNNQMFKLAASLRGKGLSDTALLAALREENQSRCVPPLNDSEVETISRSACRYTAGEIKEAFRMDRLEEVFRQPSGQQPKQTAKCSPKLRSFETVAYEEPKWLIMPYLPRGKITIIQGDSGAGKTAFACGLAALVSTGSSLCENAVHTPGPVLMISVEDDESTLRGRIAAGGGDLGKCFFLENAAGVTFTAGIVEQSVNEIGARLVIFDPLQAFLGRIDMNKANETRPVLAELAEMAKRTDCAVAIISHMNKGLIGTKAIYRALGSVDIVAASRSVLYIGRNPEDDMECIMVHIKSSNARKGCSLAYKIGDRGGVEWLGYSSLTAEDIDTVTKRKETGIEYDREPLVQVFRQLITDRPGGGFWSYADLKVVGMQILGFPPFSDPNDLKKKAEGTLARELQQRDGIIVACGKSQGGARGIRIERFTSKARFQSKLQEVTKCY